MLSHQNRRERLLVIVLGGMTSLAVVFAHCLSELIALAA